MDRQPGRQGGVGMQDVWEDDGDTSLRGSPDGVPEMLPERDLRERLNLAMQALMHHIIDTEHWLRVVRLLPPDGVLIELEGDDSRWMLLAYQQGGFKGE